MQASDRPSGIVAAREGFGDRLHGWRPGTSLRQPGLQLAEGQCGQIRLPQPAWRAVALEYQWELMMGRDTDLAIARFGNVPRD